MAHHDFEGAPEWQAIGQQAYTPEKLAVRNKKAKDEGDPAKQAAAAAARKAAVVAQPDGYAEGKDAEVATVSKSTEDTLKKLHLEDDAQS
ncbi:MAG: Tyrosine--tRNA ligase cytoplasmic [Claussenomyces sp. TS43310]|nr:MAG: Tyrosine--tRNA ligase cytoplasmic [Claussenomyces sp. TS43310]